MGKSLKLSLIDLETIILQYNEGVHLDKIAKEVKVSAATISYITKAYHGNKKTLNVLNEELQNLIQENSPFYRASFVLDESLCINYLKTKGYKILKPVTDFKEV